MSPLSASIGEQRYLILECKVGIFEHVVHKDDELAHDGGESGFDGFAGGTQPSVKLLELAVGMGGHQCGHVEGASDGNVTTTDTAASVPLAAFTRMRCRTSQGGGLAAVEGAKFWRSASTPRAVIAPTPVTASSF